ncbi:hypothetical protein DH2020_004720 [Rehmannia glutinosa]|uniref:BHLH domain-containing protein n=1 Tax=Rehmannia glutinosa TaxID=99300 RepID=A0ABR0XQW7_REHGL
MNKNHVDSFDENCWCDLIDYSSLLGDVAPPDDLCLNSQPQLKNGGVTLDVSLSGTTSQVTDSAERECATPRKRGRSNPYGRIGTKACRERMRREKLNDRFSELSAILEPGRPVKTEKSAILGDAIRILNQLKTESQEYAEMNKRLLEEINSLKVRHDIDAALRNSVAPNFSHPPVYQAEVNKVPMIPNYGFVPMWHYLPPSARDTSQDHELRPPAA